MSASRRGQDYYQALGVTPGATAEEIKQAYRSQACRLHPLASRNSADAAQFERLHRAYEVLANPAERQRYDRLLRLTARPGAAPCYRRGFTRVFDALAGSLPVPSPTAAGVPAHQPARRVALPEVVALRRAG